MIICEIGQNHNGDMDIAHELIRQASICGADIAKFQLYNVDSIFPPEFEWYREAKNSQLNYEQACKLAKWCNEQSIEFMCSVFDLERLEWCENIGVKRYKIASRSIHDGKLIEAVVKTGKPIIASLGMWSAEIFPRFNADFLYCVSEYPTTHKRLHLRNVDFDKYAGFSDHTIGIEASVVALSRGARIIEKHFTLDKRMHGADHKCSMTPQELTELVDYSKKIPQILK